MAEPTPLRLSSATVFAIIAHRTRDEPCQSHGALRWLLRNPTVLRVFECGEFHAISAKRIIMPMLSRVSLVALALVTAASTSSLMAQNQAPKQQEAHKGGEKDKAAILKSADNDMRMVLESLEKLGAKPLSTLTVEQARTQPTPADAVKAVMAKNAKKKEPPSNVRKENVMYDGAAGQQPARVYIPASTANKKGQQQTQGLPVIVYYHGGGWVIADLDTYDASAQALAEKTNAIVVSVEYRHAPEHKFPAAHEDSFAAYKWALANAAKWGGDPRRVAVAGESAGGNLAINMAIMARDQKVQAPVHMLLVYPVAGTDTNTASYKENANAAPLGRADMEWFIEKVLADQNQKNDPRLDLVGKADLANLPSATVITAQIDPLRSEGRALADKLRQAGSRVTYQNFDGVAHEFFGMAPVVADATRAQGLAVRELRQAFTQGAATGGSDGTGEPKADAKKAAKQRQ